MWLKMRLKNFIKKLSSVDVLILIFCFLTIGILNISGGVYIIIVNILISCIISLYLVTKKANLGDVGGKVCLPSFIIMISLMTSSSVYLLYYLIKFRKYPLTLDISKEELDERLRSERLVRIREDKLKKIGI